MAVAKRTGRLRKAIDVWRQGGGRNVARLLAEGLAARTSTGIERVRRPARQLLELRVQPHLLHGRVTHVHGPKVIPYALDELITLTVVRNAPLHIKSFMEHHQALGVVHSVFLDNGSDDDTIDQLCAYDRVTVLRCEAPYSRYENTLKWHLARRYAAGRWSLCVDIDELFEYPLSDRLSLAQFLGYLNARGFTAVVAQMLDMFSDVPLSQLHSRPDERVDEHHQFYDVSDMDCPPYEWSAPSSPDIRMHWGGIRRAIFGTGNGLTKAALIRLDGRVQPFVEWHQVVGANVADITCLLRHYPFVSTFAEKVRDAVLTLRYGRTTTQEYEAYARALERDPLLTLKRDTAQRYTGTDALVQSGFLVVSDAYREWANGV